MCGALTGRLIALTDYWDIRQSALVRCEQCGLIQLDPMLTEEETARGCLAYYIEETLRVDIKEQQRNHLRNFRRGVVFARSLQNKGFHPSSVLEFGPGSGYFMEGIRYIFPSIRSTVLDINPEVLAYNERHHGVETVLSVPEQTVVRLSNRFDLIIARDIMEHVADIGRMITNVSRYAKPGALFHFITPNGHEDVWKHYLTWQLTGKPSQLLINHVSYFDGQGLLKYLTNRGFSPVDYYTYNFKTTRRGQGRSMSTRLMAPESSRKSAGFYIEEMQSKLKQFDVAKEDVLHNWYIGDNRKWITTLVSRYQHGILVKTDPRFRIGHEMYGLFRVNG
jgi:SAM-dependent methyltransferase